MYASFRLFSVLRLAIPFAAACLFSLVTTQSWADPPEQPADTTDVASGGEPELGVMVTDSPGAGVLVKSVVAGFPADAAGIAPGDFIMGIDGNGINEPADLSSTIQTMQVGSTIAIDVWRDGKQVTRQVLLAASATARPRAGRAWLGVRLRSTDQVGARIAIVVPGSPAARANLLSGDIVTMIGDHAIENMNDLAAAINTYKSGNTVPVTIIRNGNELSYKIELGSVTDTQEFSFRVPLGEPNSNGFYLPIDPMIPLPPQAAPDVWSPRREDFQELKREMERIRGLLQRAIGEQTAPPIQPPRDESDASPNDENG